MIINLWGGVLNCVIVFCTFVGGNREYICKNIEFPLFDLSKY